MSQSPPLQPNDQPAAGDTVQGDQVHGDKIEGHQIRVGDITHSTAVAVGVNVTQNVYTTDPNAARADLTFEQRYCQAVIQQLDRLELFGLPRLDALSRRQPLSVAYINLAFTLTAAELQKFCQGQAFARLASNATAQRASALPALVEMIKGQSQRLSTADQPETNATSQRIDDPTTLTQLFLQSSLTRFVIRGKAGSGKSTLLQWLAIQHANPQPSPAAPTQPLLIPFFLQLRKFVGRDFPTPEEFPRTTAPQLFGTMPHGWVHRLLEAGRAVLLIDGVDEMPQQERQPLLERLQALVATYPQVTYIITSRPAAVAAEKWPEWANWMQTEEFLPLVLDDMTPDQADHLIDHWHQALCHQQQSEEQAEILTLATNLKRQLANRLELRRVTVSPLLCAMLCAVHHDRRQDLPRERALLYQECVELLLNRRDQGRKIEHSPDYPNLSELQRHEVIQSLAYWFLKNGYSTAEFAEIDTHIDSLLRLMQVGAATSEGVRRLLIERSSLLREPVAGWVDFPHRTFLEYLAAQAAVKASDFGVLLDHARDDQWRETIILAMGAARPDESARFLQRLIKKADSYKNKKLRHQLYLLAAACLETPVRRDPTIEALILDRVRQLLPPLSEDVIPALSKVGNAIIPLLAPDPDHSSQEAAYCIQVLAQIGTDAALAQITAYVTYEHRFIRGELCRAWQNFDQDVYLERVIKQMNGIFLYQALTLSQLTRLKHLKELTVLYSESVEIEPFQVLTQLKSLDLSSTNTPNLSPLHTMTSLEHLELGSIQSSDLTALSPLHNLKNLQIGDSKLQNLIPLTELKSLKSIYLSKCEIADFSALNTFPALSKLHVNPSQLEQLLVLETPLALDLLSIWNFISSNVPVIALPRFPSLLELRLSDVCILDYSVFRELPRFASLWLFGHTKFDLASLPDPTQLTSLMLYAQDPAYIAFIPNLLNLHTLTIGLTNIDLMILHELKHLRSLEILNAVVNDLTPLSAVQSLTSLTLNANQATNLRPLLDLPNLQRLRILGTGRIDRQTLQQLPHVTVERM